MKKMHLSLFIISFIHFIFIGFGGLYSASDNQFSEYHSSINSLLSFNNEQISELGSKHYQLSEFYAIEITEEQESNEQKTILNPFLTTELVKSQTNNKIINLPNALISTSIDRYLLLQTFRL
jgi:hypothetical protein